MACEQSGYEEINHTRITVLEPGWSIQAIKLAGGDAVKLLLFYNPEAPEAERQERLVEAVAKECRRNDLPLILEPIVYPVTPGQKKSEPEFADALSRLVIESARRLVPLGVDILKAEFVVDVRREKDEPKIRDAYVNRVAVGRLKILNAIASSLATPLQQRLPKDALPTLGEGWHEKYAIQSH